MKEATENGTFPFDDLWESERRLWLAFGRGEQVDLSVGDPALDDPTLGPNWPESRWVRAEVISALLLGAVPPAAGAVPGVSLVGALVLGNLDVRHGTINCAIKLRECHFSNDLLFAESMARTIDLSGSSLGLIDGSSSIISGHLLMDECRISAIMLHGAKIDGRWSLNGAHLSNPGGVTAFADRVTISNGVFCRMQFSSLGGLSLIDARISGGLHMDGASLFNPSGIALSALRLKIDGPASFGHGFTAHGEIRMRSAQVDEHIIFNGAHLVNPGKTTLELGYATIREIAYFDEGFRSEGKVSLFCARVGGQLSFDQAQLLNPGDIALDAQRLTADSGMFCSDGFASNGAVLLDLAHVTGEVSFINANLQNMGNDALSAGGLTVEGAVLCGDGFLAHGKVHLNGSHITELSFRNGTINNPGETALTMPRSQISVLRLEDSSVTGVVDVTSAQVRILHDSPPAWPERLVLEGFTYEDLQPYVRPVGEGGRLAWLDHDKPGYRPQPYEQLAAYYRRLGHDEEARQVLVAKQRRCRGVLGPLGKTVGYCLDGVVGYGYRPGRAFTWLAALLAFGSIYFTLNPPSPIDPSQHPHYQPVLYAADLVIPIVNLGQSDAWQTAGAAQWVATVLVVGGWILTTAVVAGVTRVLTRT